MGVDKKNAELGPMMTTGGVWVIDDEYSGTLRSNLQRILIYYPT